MANKKFSQFTNTPTPNANSFFVGYNSVTNDNGRTSLSDLITAIGAPSGSGTANYVSKWSGTNTLTDSLFFSDANVAKTIYGGTDRGFYLDFALSVYKFGDYNGDGGGTSLIINDGTTLLKTTFDGGDRGLYIDFGSNFSRLYNNNNLGFAVLSNNDVYIGDPDGNVNGYCLLIDNTNSIIKSNNDYFFIDYTNSISSLNNGAIGLNNSGAILKLGDYTGNVFDYTHITINTDTSLIKTSSGGADKGLYLDFANNAYTLGVNSTNCFEATNSIKRTIFNNGTSGLYLDGNSYYLGYYVNSTDPSGGMYGLYIENTYAALGDRNFNLNGLNLIVDWNDEATKIKSTYAGADKGLYLDFTNSVYLLHNGGYYGLALDFNSEIYNLSSGTRGLSIVNNDFECILGDFTYDNTGTILKINDSSEIIKTSNQGADKGLYIDFTAYDGSIQYPISILNGSYQNFPNALQYIYNTDSKLFTNHNFFSNDGKSFLKFGQYVNTTSDGGGLFRIELDGGLWQSSPSELNWNNEEGFALKNYSTINIQSRRFNSLSQSQLELYDGGGKLYFSDSELDVLIALNFDTPNQTIKTQNGGGEKGLSIDFANNYYSLGDAGKGLYIDPITNLDYKLIGADFFGLSVYDTNRIITIGDGNEINGSTYLKVDDVNYRITLETLRTKFTPLSTTAINSLTGNTEGDVAYNNTLHKLCFYDGTSWQQVTSIPM